jgi:hypothetical protein
MNVELLISIAALTAMLCGCWSSFGTIYLANALPK